VCGVWFVLASLLLRDRVNGLFNADLRAYAYAGGEDYTTTIRYSTGIPSVRAKYAIVGEENPKAEGTGTLAGRLPQGGAESEDIDGQTWTSARVHVCDPQRFETAASGQSGFVFKVRKRMGEAVSPAASSRVLDTVLSVGSRSKGRRVWRRRAGGADNKPTGWWVALRRRRSASTAWAARCPPLPLPGGAAWRSMPEQGRAKGCKRFVGPRRPTALISRPQACKRANAGIFVDCILLVDAQRRRIRGWTTVVGSDSALQR